MKSYVDQEGHKHTENDVLGCIFAENATKTAATTRSGPSQGSMPSRRSLIQNTTTESNATYLGGEMKTLFAKLMSPVNYLTQSMKWSPEMVRANVTRTWHEKTSRYLERIIIDLIIKTERQITLTSSTITIAVARVLVRAIASNMLSMRHRKFTTGDQNKLEPTVAATLDRLEKEIKARLEL